MPFTAADRTRIIQALRLDFRLDTNTSVLARLMECLQNFDNRNGTAYVDEVLAGLDEIETLNAAIAAQSGKIGLVEYEVAYEFKKKYSSGTSVTAGDRGKRNILIGRIRQYLDPNNYLAQHSAAGRVIPTL